MVANARNFALEDTVNTEAFTSPKNDLFTSSPNGDDQNNNLLYENERDAQIIQVNVTILICIVYVYVCVQYYILKNLKRAKDVVDETLRLMKMNVTQNLSVVGTPNLAFKQNALSVPTTINKLKPNGKIDNN